MSRITMLIMALVFANTASAQMTIERLHERVMAVDSQAEQMTASSWRFTAGDREFFLIADERADRMRVMSPIIEATSLPDELLERMLIANFDSALDARYAIGQDLLWAVFIHPLTELSDRFLVSAIAQTYTAAETFGTTFTSGAIVYGGGDSSSIYQDLLDKLESQDPET